MEGKGKMRLVRKVCISIYLLQTMVIGVLAQAPEETIKPDRNDALKLYVDCQVCDMNFTKQEMPYVNYMRNVQEAEVYLLITRQTTGSGGQGYTLFYNGSGKFSEMKDTLNYTSSPDDTQDIIRTKLTNTMAAGLMRYVAKTPAMNNVQVKYQGQTEKSLPQVEDKWNYWVFSLETRPRLNIEKSRKQYNWSNYVKMDRITEDWKIQLSFNHSYNKSKYIFTYWDALAISGEDTGAYVDMTTEAIKKSWSNKNLIVKSISDHWSVGMRTNVSSSTYDNYDLNINVSPSIEYNIFPYAKSNQKQLRILYGVGYEHHDYIDSTIYNKTKENLGKQTLDIAFQVQQKWGSANISLGASNYFHDFSKNRVEFDGYISLRLFKGLSINLNGGVALIHDQIELSKVGLNNTDVYLSLKQLETNVRYDASIGFTYTFGSIYNNIVNPRFGSGGGFDGMFFGFF